MFGLRSNINEGFVLYIKTLHKISMIRNLYSSFYVRLSRKLMLALIIRSNVG